MELNRNIEYTGNMLVNYINLNPEERDMVLRWRNHDDTRSWMYSDRLISEKEHLDYLERLKTDKSNSCWLVKNGPEGYIGMISLNKIDLANGKAYLGIYSNPEKKVPGSGSILMTCLKHAAFDIAKLHTLKLEVIATNERARKFYEKSGFKEEGTLKEFVLKNGKYLDVIVMGIINPGNGK